MLGPSAKLAVPRRIVVWQLVGALAAVGWLVTSFVFSLGTILNSRDESVLAASMRNLVFASIEGDASFGFAC